VRSVRCKVIEIHSARDYSEQAIAIYVSLCDISGCYRVYIPLEIGADVFKCSVQVFYLCKISHCIMASQKALCLARCMERQDMYQSRKPRNAFCRPRQVQHSHLARFAKDRAAVAQAQHDNPRRLADVVHSPPFDTKEQPVEQYQ
jgi:hypothetical protein